MYIMNIPLTDKQIKKQQYNKSHMDKCKNKQEDGTYKKYELGKVYAIKSRNSPAVYIGSTYRPCSYRFSTHKYDYKRYVGSNHLNPYTSSFDVIKHGDCYCEILEHVNCETRKQLEDRERYYIALYKDVCVNRNNKPKIVPMEIEIKTKKQNIILLEEMIEIAQEFLENAGELYNI